MSEIGIITNVLSYLFPILLFLIWYRFWKDSYDAKQGTANLIYAVTTMVLLTVNHSSNPTLVIVLSLIVLLFVILLVTLLLAYMTGKSEGVSFWKGITWSIIKIFGHPILIYPAVFLISLYADFGFNILTIFGILR